MLQLRLRSLPRKGPRAPAGDGLDSSNNSPNIDEKVDSEEGEAEEEESEDIFADFLSHMLPDDAPQFHGDPGQLLRYESPLYGPLTIMIPHYPGDGNAAGQAHSVDDGRRLFAHLLWSAALVVAQGVEDAANDNTDKSMWSVQGHRVLELGAGAGLPCIICALASASHVTITDHPSSPAFAGAIEYNVVKNVPALLRRNVESTPHQWGVLGEDEFTRKNKGRFTRIIAADCLWMLDQHRNLVKTLLWFLSEKRSNATPAMISADGSSSTNHQEEEEGEGRQGRVWIVAGFHTGRAIVAQFFETAVAMGLEIESIYERDVSSLDGRRPWEPVRAGEGPENRMRWCVVAVLKRAGTPD